MDFFFALGGERGNLADKGGLSILFHPPPYRIVRPLPLLFLRPLKAHAPPSLRAWQSLSPFPAFIEMAVILITFSSNPVSSTWLLNVGVFPRYESPPLLLTAFSN